MNVLDGVIQCWPLSDTCEVWWDAWAVVVAVAAAEVALIGAIAVAYLAYQANLLSRASQREAKLHADSAYRRDAAERARQERVILSFVHAELEGIITWARSCIALMENNPSFDSHGYMSTQTTRQTLARNTAEVNVTNISRMLQSFHLCSPGIGLRLGRTLGDFYVTKDSLTRYSEWPSVGGDGDGFSVSAKEWGDLFALMLIRFRRISSDAEHCANAAVALAQLEPT